MTIRETLEKLLNDSGAIGEYQIDSALSSIASEIEKEKLDEDFGDQANRPRNEAWNNAITEVVRKIRE